MKKVSNNESMNNDNQMSCDIHGVMASLFDEVAKNTNADISRVVAGYDKGKLCFYELDLYEETVKRYLTTIKM